MSPLDRPRYLKMNGIGNAILVVDLRGRRGRVPPEAARALAADPGTSFDQLMAIHDPEAPGTDALVRILNADGSPAGACGNGTRCVAWAITDGPGAAAPPPPTLLLDGPAGPLPVLRLGPDRFTVDMGPPRLRWDEIPLAEPFADTRRIELQVGPIDAPILHSPACLSMGNPHAVFFVEDPDAIDLGRIGPLLENHPVFPERANVSVAATPARDRVVLRTWERGAGLTRACGSAACAALVSAVRLGRTGRVATVASPGGELTVEWRESDGHVLMTGPVELEGQGVLDPALLREAA